MTDTDMLYMASLENSNAANELYDKIRKIVGGVDDDT